MDNALRRHTMDRFRRSICYRRIEKYGLVSTLYQPFTLHGIVGDVGTYLLALLTHKTWYHIACRHGWRLK